MSPSPKHRGVGVRQGSSWAEAGGSQARTHPGGNLQVASQTQGAPQEGTALQSAQTGLAGPPIEGGRTEQSPALRPLSSTSTSC